MNRAGRLAALLVAIASGVGRPAVAQDSTRAGNDTVPPRGFGTLRQEDIALRIELPGLALRVIPLAESVIRLLSPDADSSLHRLSETWRHAVDSAARRRGIAHPTVLLVSFFGLQDRAQFNPDELTVTSRNQLFRAAAILPLTPGWSTGQLSQRATVSAVYVFDEGIPLLEPLVLSYGGVNNGQWESTLRTLDQERAQVIARASARHQ